jgi:hypothetical protein
MQAESLRVNLCLMQQCMNDVEVLKTKSGVEVCAGYSRIISEVRKVRAEWSSTNITDDSLILLTVNTGDVLSALERSCGVGTRDEGTKSNGESASDKELMAWYNEGYALNNLASAEKLKRLAASGIHMAIVLVRLAMYCGSKHFPENEEVGTQMISREIEWLKAQADNGNVVAQSNLGVCYDNGTGVERNEQESVRWYRLDSDQGDIDAQFNLGLCYEIGTGVEMNEQEAVRWYRLAADQGYAYA